jgi:outer membrane cobalamin receptor
MEIPVERDYNQVLISLATKSEETEEEVPSVISVMTEQDITRWGCRDLSDILRLVPGFEFGIDVQALYGVGFRGIWAHEGKVLVMINGLTVNCFGFGNGNYFGTIPASMIEKVEIIRGPGSSLYGAFAEIAVVNIITKSKESLVTSNLGVIGKDFTYGGNVSLSVEKSKDIKLSAQIGTNYTPLSNRYFKDFFEGGFQMGSESSWRRWHHLVLQGQFKRLSFSYNRN